MVEDVEEEDEDIDIEEISSKQKVVSCINKEEAAGFQVYVQDKMIVLVEKMRRTLSNLYASLSDPLN